MLTVKGIFDGKQVTVLDDVPFTQKQWVLITFLEEPLQAPAHEVATEIDPIQALRGRAKQSRLTEKLLASRKEDMRLESAKRHH